MPLILQRLPSIGEGEEMQNTIKARLAATILGGFLLLFAPAGAADAAPAHPSASICATGHRGQAAYDRECLRTGTFKDGADLWFGTGRDRHSRAERAEICRSAKRFGGIRAAVRETYYDVAYDSFRNHRAVLTFAGMTGYVDCRAMGITIKF